MKPSCSQIGGLISILMVFPCVARAEPQRITIPAHLEYCIASNPLSASAYELPQVREALFQQLYKQIEKSALEAGLPTVGVVFVDSIGRGPDSAAAAASSTSQVGGQPAEVTYVVRQCAVVPSRGTPPLPSGGLRTVASRPVYAMLCAPSMIDACKRDLEKIVRQENSSPTDLARQIIWRVRTALTSEDSPANLAASMVDSSLLRLRDSQTHTVIQKEFVVYSAELK